MLSKNLMVAALLILGMAACNNDDCICENENQVEAQIRGDVFGMKSRVIGNQWTEDQIGVRVVTSPTSDMSVTYKNVGYQTDSYTTTALFTPINQDQSIYFKDNTEVVTFAAYAPYNPTNPNVLPGNNGKIPIDTRNKNDNEGNQISINYMYAYGPQASKQSPIVAFTKISDEKDYSFKHVMSRLVLTFKASRADGFNGDEIFTSAGDSYKLGGLKLDGNFNVTTGVAQATGATIDNWYIGNCIHTDNRVEKIRTYKLLLLPQENGADSKATISIKVGGVVYTNSQTITANLKPGTSYNYTIILKKNGLEISGSTITDWIEEEGGEGGAMSE